ncbi:MAG: hypothetical protein J6R47_02815 [Acholeplasmatales bacterium]|nr:hypothetical protein [Acholeplasmatales bacterium]
MKIKIKWRTASKDLSTIIEVEDNLINDNDKFIIDIINRTPVFDIEKMEVIDNDK